MLQLFKAVSGRMIQSSSVRRAFFTSSKKPVASPEEQASRADRVDDAPESNKVEEPEATEEQLLELKALDEKMADIEAKIVMADKDAEQATRRYNQQLEDIKKYGVSQIAKDTLDVADNLKRVSVSVTEEQIRENEDLRNLIDAVKRVQSGLTKFYKEYGIIEEEPVGKPFNPNLHEAMFEVPLPHQANGTVAHVVQSGFLIHDRVLRPARVGVVRNT